MFIFIGTYLSREVGSSKNIPKIVIPDLFTSECPVSELSRFV
jgi:hypothetical protein